MKIRLVIAAAVAASAYLGMYLAVGGSSDPALLVWGASGVFGAALGLATLNRFRSAGRSLFPIGPSPLGRIQSSGAGAMHVSPEPARAVRQDAPRPQPV
ncbi:hypothetical protein [Sinomonas sp. ASV322]|uniref:hypothetical protein n=1 Tax=Sinomonas sp. ASV322 TaxID=3041920 RepID=UPI0027DD61AB|nr:hypothetical protein [Sinomonas sp. ASV322]MDQ4501895.1 hypothetical protein [Sinomonas sp. ASV322]